MSHLLFHHAAANLSNLAAVVLRPRPNFGGCTDSPEAPTNVLMMVGSMGIAFGSSLVMKVARRRKASETTEA